MFRRSSAPPFASTCTSADLHRRNNGSDLRFTTQASLLMSEVAFTGRLSDRGHRRLREAGNGRYAVPRKRVPTGVAGVTRGSVAPAADVPLGPETGTPRARGEEALSRFIFDKPKLIRHTWTHQRD